MTNIDNIIVKSDWTASAAVTVGTVNGISKVYVPTLAISSNTTKAASTAFVHNYVSNKESALNTLAESI